MKKEKKDKRQKKDKNAALVYERFYVRPQEGLSQEQVEERKLARLTNETKVKSSKSYLSIFAKNIFTFFNLIWFIIAVALIVVKAYSNLLFLVVIVANTAIAIIQEIRAKVSVEKLSMVAAPKVKVVREGKEEEVLSENLVLDDIMILSNGDQIPADCVILEGNVEVNESLLTGESNAVRKSKDMPLLAGSFLVSGQCYARVDKVGKDNYIQQMAMRAKEFKAPQSNLFKDLNRLIKFISIALVPIGILTFLKEYMVPESTLTDWITNTSGAITSMIPAGMYLLVTVSLAVGVVKLARKKTLVRDLYSIEMLSRTNVLCLDKTGTITDGTMKVVGFVTFGKRKEESVKKILAEILYNQKSLNATSNALISEFGKDETLTAKNTLEFSSDRKYSITELSASKVYFLGATTRIGCPLNAQQKEFIEKEQSKGNRVLALTEFNGAFDKNMNGHKSKLLAFIVLEEKIRENAKETIEWFKNNGVAVKIISGDDPATVAKIAERVGVENSDKYVSLENFSLAEVEQMAAEYTVFGRVTPEQKYVLVKALKKKGYVVSMTGDGVNDTLALKEADCSIAMADGSEVARSISKLVLMDSNFTSLPAVVHEGRQVVNNVQNSATLFLMKTFFAILLSIVTLIFGISYPYQPVNMILLETFVIGIPSFILTFEPNNQQIKGNFLPQVFKKTIPRALLMFIAVLIVIILNETSFVVFSEEGYRTLAILVLTYTGVLNLASLCFPMNWIRGATLAGSVIIICLAILVMGNFFMVSEFSTDVLITFFSIFGGALVLVVLAMLNRKNLAKLSQKLFKKKKKQV